MNAEQINNIYRNYFELVDSYFGSIKHYLGAEEDSHIDLGINIASYPLISDLILDAIDDLHTAIEDFWAKNVKEVIEFVKKQKSLKCLYSGDISPVILENFVKRSALYIDTVILPDPVYNLTLFQKQILSDKKYYLNKLVRHVFNIWKLKDLVLADTSYKAILILPINLQIINDQDKSRLLKTADAKFSEYTSYVFEKNFTDKESALDFLRSYTRSDSVFKTIKHRDLLPNKFVKFEDFDKFLKTFFSTDKYSKIKFKSIGESLGIYLRSQFIRVQEHKFFCQKLTAEPIYDYELPWFFFTYEVGGVDMDAAIVNALQREQFEWISKVPLPALKILREEDKLDYMRNVLRSGITDLKAKKDKDLLEISQQIEKNLKTEFERQKSEVKTLEKEVAAITKKEIPITTGGFLAGFIPYLGNVISLISVGRDVANLLKDRNKKQKTISEKGNEFINLLLKAYEKN